MTEDIEGFGRVFSAFMEAMTEAARQPESELAAAMRGHLGPETDELPVTAAELPMTSHPNLQLALDDVFADAEMIGYRSRHMMHMTPRVADLLAGEGMAGPITPGPPQFADVEVGDGRVIRCLSAGILLATWQGAPLLLALSVQQNHFGASGLVLELLSPRQGAPSDALGAIRAAMRTHNVYRGKVISLHGDEHREGARAEFHVLADVARDAIVLPPGTLERLERHAIGMVQSADRLRAAGRHLKRGILLHGPPGTGKTLTVGYLLSAMPGRTVVLLTGRGLGFIEQAISIGRELAPATVVFEDVDLVASERTMMMGDNGTLFELLNQMEGLGDDEDLLFLLTSNRPDLLEPALAARPGRVDLAVEIPLPDAAARERLLALYLAGADVDAATAATVVERTEGVSGAFIRELVRQAALTAALAGRERPESADLELALDELLADRSAITRRLLGEPGTEPGPPEPTAW
jgi:hypothetical protein